MFEKTKIKEKMFNLENISRMLLLAHQILAAFVIGISAAKLSLGAVIVVQLSEWLLPTPEDQV